MLTIVVAGAFAAYAVFSLTWGLTHPPVRRPS